MNGYDKAKAETTKLLIELDFEPASTLINNRLPYGWSLAGSSPSDYEAGIDHRIVHSGNASGYLKSRRFPKGFGTMMQTFKADRYREKRVQISGYVKALDVAAWAGLWMRVDGPDQGTSLSFDNMQSRLIQGTTDWRKYEIVLDVPINGEKIAFGIILSGEGKVWIDDVQFDIVGNDIPSTNLTKDIPEQPINLNFEIVR